MLYYTGTVLLRMSEKEFWSCTPRKLNLLSRMYVKFNSTEEKESDVVFKGAKKGYIDQVL